MTQGPQLGAVALAENVLVEAGAIGYELVRHDVGEWATLAEIDELLRKVKEALREGRTDLADHWADKVIELARKLRTIDVRENRNHRKLTVARCK